MKKRIKTGYVITWQFYNGGDMNYSFAKTMGRALQEKADLKRIFEVEATISNKIVFPK